jgi:hypothetical protein
VHEYIDFSSVHTNNKCEEKDLEIFAIKLSLLKIKIVITICIDHLLEITEVISQLLHTEFAWPLGLCNRSAQCNDKKKLWM